MPVLRAGRRNNDEAPLRAEGAVAVQATGSGEDPRSRHHAEITWITDGA
ncbi:hypothetical protein [Candidatus Chloroploca sp. Khr17]|nr:hypothetical protein [Candidatus Chloroploca sp. Khr17]